MWKRWRCRAATCTSGGKFTTAGAAAANYIAVWNGSTWSPLGSGMNGEVNALAVLGANLYVGGEFTAAGGKPSLYFAEAYLVAPPGGLADTVATLSPGAVSVEFYGNPGQLFGVQRTTNLAPPFWATVNSNPLTPAATARSPLWIPTPPAGPPIIARSNTEPLIPTVAHNTSKTNHEH